MGFTSNTQQQKRVNGNVRYEHVKEKFKWRVEKGLS